jgi:hypothetical protein
VKKLLLLIPIAALAVFWFWPKEQQQEQQQQSQQEQPTLGAGETWHLYLVPVIGTGLIIGDPPVDDSRRPKYLTTYACADYGMQPVMLCASFVDDATDTSLQANADVTRIPDNLDQQLSAGAVTAVQNALEARNLPALWVDTTMTYRQVLRTVGGFFAFMQRYAVIANTINPVLTGSVTLSTQYNQLPQAARNNLQETATSLGLSTTGLSGTNTLRQILKNIADQWGQRPIILGEITI